MSAPVLEVVGLRHAFGGLVVLRGVDLRVERGVTTALVGPNGSGKTTLFNLSTGLIRPQGGRVLLSDTDVTRRRPEIRSRLGMARTFQAPHLFTDMSAVENVLLGQYRDVAVPFFQSPFMTRRQRRRLAEAIERAAELLTKYGLGSSADRIVGELPSGEQRLIEVVRAVIGQPCILLLDEPTTGLNAQEIGTLSTIIGDLQAAGGTPFVISHDMAFVGSVAERIHVLDFGELIASGTAEQIRGDAAVRAAFLGSTAISGTDRT